MHAAVTAVCRCCWACSVLPAVSAAVSLPLSCVCSAGDVAAELGMDMQSTSIKAFRGYSDSWSCLFYGNGQVQMLQYRHNAAWCLLVLAGAF